jgi:hypothetical protein
VHGVHIFRDSLSGQRPQIHRHSAYGSPWKACTAQPLNIRRMTLAGFDTGL